MKQTTRTERLNLCLKPEDRKAIKAIANYEQRDDGYVASLLVEWAILQYANVGGSFPALWASKNQKSKRNEKLAMKRLALLGHAKYARELDEGLALPFREKDKKSA